MTFDSTFCETNFLIAAKFANQTNLTFHQTIVLTFSVVFAHEQNRSICDMFVGSIHATKMCDQFQDSLVCSQAQQRKRKFVATFVSIEIIGRRRSPNWGEN